MEIYLVQHAEAKSKQQDPERPLSEKGRLDAVDVAGLAARLGFQVNQIRHSGKTRAEQTASILGEALSPAKGVVAAPGLGPVDDVMPMGRELSAATEPVMLVGHLPFMERLAGYLLVGNPDDPVVHFHNAAIVCLVWGHDRWQVDWILTPDMASV
jgi:phosphohistidine phosphatase